MLFSKRSLGIFLLVGLAVSSFAVAQSAGNSTSVNGTVVDPSGSVVVNAKVEIHNPVSQFDRTTTTDSAGNQLSVNAEGFAPYSEDIDVRSVVPLNLNAQLQVKGSSEVVTVESSAQDLLENEPTFHTDVDRFSTGLTINSRAPIPFTSMANLRVRGFKLLTLLTPNWHCPGMVLLLTLADLTRMAIRSA
jgi:hypothetical protein